MSTNGQAFRGYHPEKGCTVQFMAAFFKMNPSTLRNRLANCPCETVGRTSYYDPRVAIDYLATPKLNIEELLGSMQPHELPVPLQKEYWQMRKVRLEVEHESGELWRTDKVMDTFVDVFQAIKSTIQLWPDRLNREVGITAEQRELLLELFDEFQDSLIDTIKDKMEDSEKTSELVKVEEEVVEMGKSEQSSDLENGKTDFANEFGIEKDSVLLEFL